MSPNILACFQLSSVCVATMVHTWRVLLKFDIFYHILRHRLTVVTAVHNWRVLLISTSIATYCDIGSLLDTSRSLGTGLGVNVTSSGGLGLFLVEALSNLGHNKGWLLWSIYLVENTFSYLGASSSVEPISVFLFLFPLFHFRSICTSCVLLICHTLGNVWD